MSYSIPNPFYAIVQKIIEARVRQEAAKMKATCGNAPSCAHQPAQRQLVRRLERTEQPGLHKILNEVPTQTGIVFVNGKLHSIQPPGSNPHMAMAAAGGPEVKPGESATYSSAADHVHYAGGCPHCGLSRGVDGNLYDAMGVITTTITSGCVACPCESKYSCVDGECLVDEEGPYSSLTECQSACGATLYKCIKGRCVLHVDGTYHSFGLCTLDCVSPMQATTKEKTAQPQEEPCGCAKKALLPKKPIDRKSIMM